MRIEEEHLDLLQNIEVAIVFEFRRDNSLLDLDARDAVNALVRHYEAEQEGRNPPKARIGERAQRVFNGVMPVCEWRIGRGPSPAGEPAEPEPLNSLAEIVAALKRIRKSIDYWNKEAGRQGYLSFVSQHIV